LHLGKTHANKSGIEESKKLLWKKTRATQRKKADYIRDDKREHEFAGGKVK
jgi:hypothetical protein